MKRPMIDDTTLTKTTLSWALALFLTLLSGSAVSEEDPATNPYTVNKGDTLWDLSDKYLENPRRWPDIWERNAHINSPHWIYPGDKVWLGPGANGSGSATSSGGLPVVKLTPQAHTGPAVRQGAQLSDSKKHLIKSFLEKVGFIVDDGFEGDGIVIGSPTKRYALGQHDTALVRFKTPLPKGAILSIFRNGPQLTDPESDESLGTLAYRLGTARVERNTPEGPMVRILASFQSIHPGDLIARYHPANTDYELLANPPVPLEGHIVGIVGGMEEGGTNQVVTVGVGRRDKAVQGSILSIIQRRTTTEDPETKETVWYPSKEIGQAILFHVGEKASFALLAGTLESVTRGDLVQSANSAVSDESAFVR
ncbi:MAG: LysM peptidoglycan-binding domain-containing protein [Magnetococcales bacterium]|nr:LysM peptidoglycan-binding domain-containing protein [Magnetococcales bacterium]